VIVWALTTAALALPLLLTSFPLATDLPQHLSQIHLAGEVLAGRADLLVLNWWAPNNLVYLPLAGLSLVAAPPLSGKLALLLLIAAWVAAHVHLARRLERPVEHAVLASAFVFNVALYWGLLNFLIGWPVFALWLCASLKPRSRATWFRLLGLSLLLYASHALWFVMGAAWLAVACLFAGPRSVRDAAWRLSALVPVGIVAALWYPSLVAARTGASATPRWLSMPHERLWPPYLATSMLRGVEGTLEPIFLACVLLWVIVALVTNRGALGWTLDVRLLACAALFLALVLYAPEVYLNTIFFSQRWLPCAAILLLLALPAPRLNRRVVMLAAFALVVAFSGATARIWSLFERTEMTGLDAALVELPEHQRVLGLDFVKTSPLLRGRPFLQTFAYAQAMKGASLSFSWAEHASGIVRYRERPPRQWTPGLEWFAERVRDDDLRWFDYVLVNASPEFHATIPAKTLRPVTTDGRWRLYQVPGGLSHGRTLGAIAPVEPPPSEGVRVEGGRANGG
jgi:hypothetical protein